jgi:uncharacterized protein YukE
MTMTLPTTRTDDGTEDVVFDQHAAARAIAACEAAASRFAAAGRDRSQGGRLAGADWTGPFHDEFAAATSRVNALTDAAVRDLHHLAASIRAAAALARSEADGH